MLVGAADLLSGLGLVARLALIYLALKLQNKGLQTFDEWMFHE